MLQRRSLRGLLEHARPLANVQARHRRLALRHGRNEGQQFPSVHMPAAIHNSCHDKSTCVACVACVNAMDRMRRWGGNGQKEGGEDGNWENRGAALEVLEHAGLLGSG
jgi:hypothetical protein